MNKKIIRIILISTLHTVGAVNTIDRIIDVFPPAQQQIRVQLAQVLKMVVSQQLLPTVDGGMVPAFEIMHLNNAVRTLVRESRIHQSDNRRSKNWAGRDFCQPGFFEVYYHETPVCRKCFLTKRPH